MSLLLSESPSLFQIRSALAQDAEGLIQLHFRAVQAIAPSFYPSPVRAAWSPPPSPARAAWMRQTIAAPERRVLLAAAEGRLGGFAICAPEQGLMQALYVDPACTGLGLGQRLLGAAEEAMRQAGCARVTLKASLNALGFYQAMGYRLGVAARQPLADGVEMDCREMDKAL
ncbi:GNAT family N-acetyltransferase [Chromobacterium aquaticum]|uniref:GNAT family N-acetyltransferase n=1 Tax=Chromobacterium aquaticum TaxID=467180 RepID=A0ABV8ZMG2_9NEIS|nr:GNAT family N-acetyltransferase [Chromobacterium aquaticum]MCD5362471.1 GNAT family N-acetyltransferase [Chromobacterium aquaticum]